MTTKEDIADATLLYFETRANLLSGQVKYNSPEYRKLEALHHATWDALKKKVEDYK